MEHGAQQDVNPMPSFIDGYLPYLLAQVSHSISAEFHVQAHEAGLSVTQWRVLSSLCSSGGGMTIGELAFHTVTKQPTLSKVVQRMAVDGLVARTDVRADRRQTRVSLTAKGGRLVEVLCRQAMQHQRAVLQPLGEARAAELMQMLRTLMMSHALPPE
ncbi:MarR family winged helix-turn-helix transcriptional regulator [Bordetella sp. FB-8]|uniref:MarR family winged helix-turn-helix transcriptional regulator n=1 Tax=Bordetella sp. FB-8 TaxID=1159870 RepID=UPI0003625808|nr:MarR family winged helix-turn-helix transcriptional regulator [Bordetella sp. FB-8]